MKKESLKETLKSLGFALVAVIILNSFVLASFQVPTGSMENTVMAGDFLFVNKFIYGGTTPPTVPLLGILTGKEIELPYVRTPGFADVEKGDVIVFIFPGYRDDAKALEFQYYLKRCVAVSGDTLQIIDKKLMINGVAVSGPEGVQFYNDHAPAEYADPKIFPKGKPWNKDFYGPLVVPGEGDVIALTLDNIGEWATFIRREGHEVEIRGTDIFIDGKKSSNYKVERNYVFGMGDNRDDSLDSRFWGFIPEEYVIGTPMMVYWSMDQGPGNFFKRIQFSRMFTLID